MSHRPLLTGALLGLSVGLAVGVAVGFDVGDVTPGFDSPDGEVNVTCYTWVENGTAQAVCDPPMIYAPDRWVNISTEPCEAWTPQYGGEFAREAPCP